MNMKLIPVALIGLLLGGCSSMFNIDKTITECSMSGRGTPCVSARAAYYASQGYDPEAEVAAAMDDSRRKNRRGDRNTVSPFTPQPLQGEGGGNGYPSPLLNQAKVMRVWINSYEDEEGNLVYPTRVYTEVEQRKWDTGYSLRRTGNKAKRVTPLVAKQAATPEAEPASASEAAKSVENQPSQTQEAPTQNSSNEPIPNSLPQGVIPPLQ